MMGVTGDGGGKELRSDMARGRNRLIGELRESESD